MKIHFLCKELKNNFQRKIDISTQDLHCVSRSTVRSYQACLGVAVAGSVCNKLLMTVAVLRDMIVRPLCIFTHIIYFLHNIVLLNINSLIVKSSFTIHIAYLDNFI
jgi:hypothetical protein